MRAKRLRDVAYAIPPMFGTGRMYTDFDLLMDKPDGILTINLLDGRFSHSAATLPKFEIARFLSDWTLSRLADYEIPLSSIDSAELRVEVQTNRIPTDKKRIVSFDLRITSSLSSEGHTFSRTLDKHVYHHPPIPPLRLLAARIHKFVRSRPEWIRFQIRERAFFEAAKRLQPGMTADEIRAILGPPTTASELYSGKDHWVYRRGTYSGIGGGAAWYTEQYSLILEVTNGRYVGQRRSIICS